MHLHAADGSETCSSARQLARWPRVRVAVADLSVDHVLEAEGVQVVCALTVVIEGHPHPLAPVAREHLGHLRPAHVRQRSVDVRAWDTAVVGCAGMRPQVDSMQVEPAAPDSLPLIVDHRPGEKA